MPRARVCGPRLGGGRQGAQTLRTRLHLSVHCRLLRIRQSIKQGGMDVEQPKGPSSARTRCCLHPGSSSRLPAHSEMPSLHVKRPRSTDDWCWRSQLK